MKLKHFMFALVAMLSCFTFTANAQTEGTTNDVEEAALFGDDEYFVNCDYTSSTSGWGKTRFSNYDAAFAVAKSATLAKYRSATIIIEKTNTISGNCLADEHDGYAKLAVVVKAGATIGVAISKWDMTYPVTVEPGGAIVSARGKSSGYINSHIKNTLTIGSNGAGEKAVLDFLGGSYQSGSVSIMYNGNIVANNAIIEVGDFGLSGTGTFNNCDINVGGVLATGKNDYYKQTMTNTTVTVGGTNYQNENTYYSTEGTLLHNLTLDNSTIAIGNGDGVVVKTVTLKNGSAWTVAEGASVNTTNAKVTVYGSVEVPKELENNSAANELVSNTAVSGYTPTLPAGVTNLTVELTEVEATAEATTKVTFNVEPKNASGQKVSNPSDEITFRLPVPAAWAGKANVYHEGTLLGAYTIKEESGAKYVEVSSANFSEFSIKAVLFDGEGTEASPYIIDSSDKLAALRNEVNGGEAYEGVYFKLTSDITLSGEWTAIGNGSRSSKSYTGNAFKGVFDGDNYTISGLTITSTTAADAAIGLFGVVDGGTVKNLNLTNVNINVPSSNLAGAAIGMMLNKATAENITVSGAIVGNDGVGGIVGRMIINGTIANCTNNASVTTSYGGIGGIVGKPYYDNASDKLDFATITNCINNGTITAGSYAGGIAGLARANVTGCVNNGEIKGGTQTGGIIGELIAAGTVSGNENNGKVSGTSHVGGIIGDYTQTSAYSYYNVTIANNINRGEIAATGDRAAILGCNNVDGFTAMTATGNKSFYYVEGLELFGNPEDMVIDATNKFILPTVAIVNGQEFSSFTEALEATKTMTGDVTVEIYDKVTFNQPLIGNYTSINFVGKEADAEMYLDVQGYTTATGKKVSFTDLKLSKSEGGFIANAGFMNVAFGIYDVVEVTYTNCTFENGACASSGKVTFNGCTFKKSWDKYGLWAYGNVDVTVQGSTFADYRGIKMYAENGAAESVEKANLTVKNTNFSAVDNKPAIVLTYGESVVLEGNTYSSTGTFELDLDGKPNGVAVTSDVAPVCFNDHGACGVLVDGKIYTTVAQAAEVATSGSTVTLLHNSAETVALPMGVTLNKNNFEAAGVTVVKPVAKIGEQGYATFAEAVAAAQAGDEVVIFKAGTYDVPTGKNLTITGAVEGVLFGPIAEPNLGMKNYTFNNVTFNYANDSYYKGLQYAGEMEYNNCTFNGQVFLYGQKETFNKCTFNQTTNNYNVWTYSAKEVAFNECTFNSAGKSVLIYHEDATVFNNVAVAKSTFNASQAVEGKAAIEMDASLTAGINLTIDAATTATGFGAGNVSGNSLWNNKKGNNDLANNDITVKVGDTVVLAPIFEAQIGDVQYRNFQDAIDAVQNGETITVLRDIATNVEIKEKDNVKVTIDGNGMKMTGTIKVVALSSDNDRRITIKNFKFEDTTSASVDFITSVETNHYPRITVEGCTFTGSGDATDVALRLKSSKNVEIKNCTGKGLHSFIQNTSGWNLTIENVTVTDSKSGFALGTVQGVTVKGCEADVKGYGIRLDAQYNNNAVIESNKVKAFIPVVVRKAEVNSNITVKGTNTFNASNTDGLWMAVGTSEYEANGTKPTAATGKVKVVVNSDLPQSGLYGNHKEGSLSVAFAGETGYWGECGGNANYSFEFKFFNGETYMGSTSLNDKDNIIDGDVYVTWNMLLNAESNTDEYWTMAWTVAPTATMQPNRVEQWIDGAKVAECAIQHNGPDNLNEIKAIVTDAAGKIKAYQTSFKKALEAAQAGDAIELLADVEANEVILIGKSLTINGNGHKVTSSANRVFRVTTGDVVVTMNKVDMVSTAFSSYTSDIRGISIDGPSSNVKLTLNNCSVDFDPESGSDWAYAVNMSAGCEGHTLTINGGTYEGANVINIWGNNHKITIDGATLNNLYNAPQNNYYGQCVRFEGTGCETTIKNSVFNGVHAVVVGEATTGANTVAQENNTDNTKTYDVKAGTKYYYTLAEAFADVEDNATIEVRRDIEETETAVNTKNVVLDLNGKTVTMVYTAKATKNHTMISNSGNLTIQSSVEGGKLSYTYAGENLGTSYSANTVTSNPGSVLTVKSGTIENLTFDQATIAYAIDGLTNGGAGDVTVNIEGGVITSKRQAVRIFANSTTNTGALNISGGDITGRVIVQNASAKANKAALNVTGGTFNANEYKSDVLYVGGSNSATIDINATVSGGTFNGEITETNVSGFISGGTFANPVAAQFCAEGFMPNKNVDGTYGVVLAEDVVASIDGVTYETLAAAVEAAQAGATVELLADVTLAGGYTDAAEGLRIEKEITINGKGHTIDCGKFMKGIRVYNLRNESDFQVIFNNITVVNNVANGRCIDTRSGNINLKVNSSTLIATNGNSQPLTIGGNDPVHRVTLNETTIDAGTSGYAVISFVSTNVDIQGVNNSTISGFAAFYLKGDAKTTNLNLGQGVYTGTNNHAIESGVFGTVVLEGDNNVVNLMGTNATVKAIANNTAPQAAFLVRGANNTIKVTKESAKIITEGNAYEAIVDADNAATTKFIDMGIERKLVAEADGRQFYSFEEAVRFAGNEGTIKIVNDFELAEAWTIPAGKKYTLDLNGKTVSYTSAVAGEDMITNRGNLTITDSSDAKTGKLAYVNTDTTASNVTVSTISTEAGSTLVVDGGTIENKTVKADGSSIYSYAIDILTNGNLGDVNVTINGGTVYSDYMAIRQFNNGTACKNSLTINDGYIYGAKRAVQVHMDNNAAVTAIKGGKVEAGAEGYALCNFAATSDLAVTGGEFIGAVYSARENFISGGIYDAEVYAGYCAEGYMPNKNANGKYGVVLVANAYASIDGVTYGSLKAAINAAKAGETITLLQNVKENVTISKNLTLDGAGKTITGMITTDGKSLKVTIKNVNFDGDNGTINYAMRADDDLNLVVDNCTASNYIYGFLYANKSNDKIVVKNVTVENCAEYGAYLVAFNKATFENFTVKGNTKYGIVVANAGARTVNLKNVTFEGAEQPLHINEIGTGKVTFNFSGSNEMSKAEFYTSQYVKVVAAAQVGTKVCGSLNDAFAAAQTDDTVKMLSNLNLGWNDVVKTKEGYDVLAIVENKNIVLDMNEKKISVNHQSTTERIYSVLFVENGAGLTVTGNGSIDIDADDNAPKVAYMFWKRGETGYIVIENGNYHADNTEDSMVYTNGSNIVTVNGGTFILDANGTRVNGFPWIFNVVGNDAGYINVYGGTYNYDIRKQYYANEVKLGEGLTTTNNGDGTWTVVPAVATVGEETFGSIQEAIDAAPDGETVTLIADVALDTKKYTTQVDNLVVLFNVKGKTVTFDLNGKKIDVNASAANLGGKMLAGVFSADLEGNFIITDSSAEGTGAVTVTVNDAKVYSVFISENAGDKTKSGKMTVNAGNFTTVGKLANAMIYADTDKVVTINGGTFICDGVSASENYPWFVNTLHNNVMQVIVNGGTFNIDINHQYRPFEVFVPENLAVKANGNGTWTIVPAQAYVTEMLGEWVDEPGSREHKVGYATVAEAIAATNDLGKTVTILAGDHTMDIAANKAGVTVQGEVDENGHNLVNITGCVAASTGTTVKNLNVKNELKGKYDCALSINHAKDVTIDGVNLSGYNAITMGYADGNITIKNSVIEASNYAVHFDGNAGGVIAFENSTITGWCAYASTIESVTYTNCTLNKGSKYHGQRFYNKNVNFVDCTFEEGFKIELTGKNQNVSFTDADMTMDDVKALMYKESYITSHNVTLNQSQVTYAVSAQGKLYNTLQAAIDALPVGGTATYWANLKSNNVLTAPVTVPAGVKVVINLNDFDITYTSEVAGEAMITNNGELGFEGKGKVVYTYTGAADAAYTKGNYTIANRGKLTIDGGIIENATAAMKHASYAIDNEGNAELVINGGQVINTNNYAIRQFASGNNENSIIVNGGEVSGTRAVWMQAAGSNTADAPAITLDVTGGKLIGTGETGYKLAVYSYNYGNSLENVAINIEGGEIVGDIALTGGKNKTVAETVEITGGTITNIYSYADDAVADKTMNITGGTFLAEIAETYLAWGYQLLNNAEVGKYDVKWTARRESVTIVDGDYTEFVNENDITVGTLTYKRTLNTGWNALYIPFEIPMSLLENYDVNYINDVRGYDNDDNGTIEQLVMEGIRIKEGTLRANFPYLIRVKEGAPADAKNLIIEQTETLLNFTEENTIMCSSVFLKFEISGTYRRLEGADIEGRYALTSAGKWAKAGANAWLNPFRLYMTMTAVNGSPVVVDDAALQSIRIHTRGESDDETTDIENAELDNKAVDYIYDLQGRRVLEPQKGNLYIINGKKVIF